MRCNQFDIDMQINGNLFLFCYYNILLISTNNAFNLFPVIRVSLTVFCFLLLPCEGFDFLVSCPDLLLGYAEFLFFPYTSYVCYLHCYHLSRTTQLVFRHLFQSGTMPWLTLPALCCSHRLCKYCYKGLVLKVIITHRPRYHKYIINLPLLQCYKRIL